MQTPNTDPRFDFLVLSADGAGKHAIDLYLNLHPRIFSVRGNEVDAIINNPYQSSLKAALGDLAVTCWIFSNLASLVADGTMPARIIGSAKPKFLIQLVRDPIKMMISLYNQRMQRSLIGSGRTPPVPAEYFEELISGAFYHKASSLISGHFAERMIIDTTDISGTKAPETFRSIFQSLNLKTDEQYFQNPALVGKQNDIVQTLLRNTPLNIQALGVTFRCSLQLAGSLEYMSTFNVMSAADRAKQRRLSIPDGQDGKVDGWGQVVGIINDVPDDIRPHLKGSSLRIMVDERTWARIDPKVRELIKTENLLASALQHNNISLLYERIRHALAFKPITANDLDGAMIDKIKARLSVDIKELFKLEPSLRGKWEICGDI